MPEYTIDNLKLACEAVGKGMSLRVASLKYQVPKTTIHNHMKKSTNNGPSRNSKLSTKDEERLVSWYVYCKQTGFFNLNNYRLGREASKFFEENLTKDWSIAFNKRHPKVQEATKMFVNDKYFDKTTLVCWYKALAAFCREHGVGTSFQQPDHLFYCSKLHFSENIKVMLTYSATGMATPPLLVHENLKDLDAQAKNDLDTTDCDLPKGWLKYNNLNESESTCIYYLQYILNSYLKQKNVTYPIFLFMDFQDSPISLQLYELCCSLNIYIINSYPSAFRLTQQIQTQLTNAIKDVPTANLNCYIDILKDILITQLTKSNMSTNFLESGIYPFDISKVNVDKLPKYYLKIPNYYSKPRPLNEIAEEAKADDLISQNLELVLTADVKRPKINTNLLISFDDFQTTIGTDMLDKLDKSLVSKPGESENSAEFEMLLNLYRKFHTKDEDDAIEVIKEPIDEDPLNEEYFSIKEEKDIFHELF